MRPLRKESRLDYIGTYVAYIYADGHVETHPPNRPQTKEDVQRERRIEATRERALAVLAAERARSGLRALPNSTVRENTDTVAGKVLLDFYHNLLHRLSRVAVTATAQPGAIKTLLYNVPLGGRVVGTKMNARPEFDFPHVPVYGESQLPTRI